MLVTVLLGARPCRGQNFFCHSRHGRPGAPFPLLRLHAFPFDSRSSRANMPKTTPSSTPRPHQMVLPQPNPQPVTHEFNVSGRFCFRADFRACRSGCTWTSLPLTRVGRACSSTPWRSHRTRSPPAPHRSPLFLPYHKTARGASEIRRPARRECLKSGGALLVWRTHNLWMSSLISGAPG